MVDRIYHRISYFLNAKNNETFIVYFYLSNDLRFLKMVIKTDSDIVEIKDETIKRMFAQGVKDWFELGLRFSSQNTWKGENWILDVVNQEKFFLAKIRYGF